ncbi:McrB family protein [Lewinella cohaerens]|uniref:McrB family protein n=1 Tax=Lewinella cohaerens TaxID=70995 RepID=UPI00035D773C|nr:AAA family ATPase [Lewinella cohaerens]
MTQQEIEKTIQGQHFQNIIRETDFYFLKGQLALKNWLELNVSDQMKEDLIRLSSDYTQFLEITEINPEFEKIKDNLFEIIAYCDNRAKDKARYNRYDGYRVLADASVRMGNWVESLVKFKFKHAEITGKSILNAFNYLLSPQDNCTILSDNHRQMVSVNLLKKDYSPPKFIHDLKEYFDEYKLKLQNQDNYTYLISSLVYAFRTEWIEEVIGLMASDGTGWQEDATNLEAEYSGLITWNSKKPSGGQKTLNFLREKVKDGQSFPLYYSSKGHVQYRANIVDFAINAKELSEKKWDEKKIKYFHSNFGDYKDDTKKAYILFLAESIEEISPKPISDFKFYGNYSKPRQDNLSPIKEIVNDDEIINPGLVMTDNTPQTPLNQILFGPPGTGKTYHTINEALTIVGVDISGLTRPQIKEEFDKKLKEGQIVFTTFHQSMSYEEFIEGIKPIEPEKDGDEVIYRVEPGLFKKLSIEASFDIAKFSKSKETAEALDFSYLYDLFIEEVQEKLINEEEVELKTKSGGTVLIDSISQQGNIIIKHHNGIRTYTVSKPRLTKLQAAIGSLDSVSNINNEFREVIGGINSSAYWSALNAIKQTGKRVNGKVEEKSYTYNDKVEVVQKMTKKDFDTTQGKNYVLIIDEINRGNVSQIFGELITLIEADKRLGKEEALKVMLPYSKEKFGVPANLYIIGTMNTADRSVEALDTALRRRFSFTEMPPKPELLEPSLMLQRLWMKNKILASNDSQWIEAEKGFIDLVGATILNTKKYEYMGSVNDLNIPSEKFEGVIKFEGLNLKDVLKTINRRIEKLLDRDHLIGHSYFIRVNDWMDLEESFYRNIIPLLQEYFFGDYAKIGAVLGSGFVYSENEPDQVDFATGYENEDFAEKAIYQIIDYRPNQSGSRYIQNGMTFQKAIRLLMN